MGAVAEFDFYRDGRHSIENDLEFGHASIWYGAGKNASGDLGVVDGVGRQFRADHQTLAVPRDRRQLEGIEHPDDLTGEEREFYTPPTVII